MDTNNIVIKRLFSKNYCGFFGEREFSFDGISGTISLIGDNGSGKSTILNLFLFIFYGRGKFNTIRDLINTEALKYDKNPEVYAGCDFYIGRDSTLYTIKREISESSMVTKLFINGKLYSRKRNEVENFILNLVNVPYEIVINTIFSEQKKVSRFFNLSNSEKKEFFDFLLNIGYNDLIETNQELSNKEKKRYEFFNFVKTQKENYISNVLAIEKNKLKSFIESVDVDLLLQEKKELENKRQKYIEEKNVLVKELNELGKIEEKLSELEKFKSELLLLQNKLVEIEREIFKLMSNIETKKEEVSSYKKEVNNLLKEKIAKNKFDSNRLIKGLTLIFNLKNEIYDIENELSKNIFPNLEKLNSQKISLSLVIKNLHNEINKMLNSNYEYCVFCGAKLTPEHVEKIKKEIEEKNNNLISTQKELEHVNSLISQLKHREENLQNNLLLKKEKLAKYESHYNKLNEEYQNHIKIQAMRKERAIEIINKKNMIKSLNKNIIELKSNLNVLKKNFQVLSENYVLQNDIFKEKLKEVENLKNRYNELNNIKNRIQTVNEAIHEIDGELEHIVSTVSKYDYVKAKYEEILLEEDKTQSYLEKLSNIIKKVKHRYELSLEAKEILIKSFGDYSIKSITNIFNILNKILNYVKSNIYIKPVFSISKNRLNYDFIFYKNNVEVPYSLISGGEETLLGISFRVALWKYFSVIYPNSISFIMLDEIFEGLSPQNSDLVFNYVSNLKNMFKYIFLTSHTDHVLNTEHKIIL